MRINNFFDDDFLFAIVIMHNVFQYSYIRAKEEELTKTREANENFMTNKFEATFGRFIEKSKTPAGTGLIGEEFVEQVLSKLGFGIHYENVAQKGHKGDFRVMFPKSEITILLEVKNLSETYTSLPRKDIDKFFKNLNDSSYHAGNQRLFNVRTKVYNMHFQKWLVISNCTPIVS